MEVWAWLRYLGDGSDSNAEDHNVGAAAETQSQQVRLDRKETAAERDLDGTPS